MMRKPWDESKIPPEKRAWLYENYHPLFIMRHRMSKQADAILGMYLHSNLFSEEEIRRNYDFYQKVTLHHSSLSTCIFGIVEWIWMIIIIIFMRGFMQQIWQEHGKQL